MNKKKNKQKHTQQIKENSGKWCMDNYFEKYVFELIEYAYVVVNSISYFGFLFRS